MRPANVLVDMQNHDVLFIDWQSASKIGNIMCSLRSSVPQIPSRWIPFVLGQDCSQLKSSARDDIEQWIYAVSFFRMGQKFPWMVQVNKSQLSFRHENEVYESVYNFRQKYYQKYADPLEKALFDSFNQHQNETSGPGSEYDKYERIMNSY